MAGLLGDSMDDPRTMALLALAGGLSNGKRFLPGLLQGAQAYGGTMAQAKQQEEQRKRGLLQEQLMQMQVQQAQQGMAERQAATERETRDDGIIRNAFAPMPGPNPDGAAGVAPRFDVASLLGQGISTGGLGKAVNLNQLVNPAPKEVEIKEFREVRMPDGSVQVVGFGKDGKAVQTGQTPFKSPEVRDFGGFLGGVDPITGQVSKLGAKTQSPDSLASNALTMRGQNMTDARAREANAIRQAGGGNPRTGPMSVTLQKELLESDDSVQSSASVVRALESAKAQNAKAYSGYFAKGRAQLVSNIGGSQSADATIDIDNLMTGQGLDQMKAIFGAAPTEGERKILLDMQASVDKTPAQREAIMDRAIAAAKRRAAYADSKARSIRDGSYLTDGVTLPPEPAGSQYQDLGGGFKIKKGP